MKKGINILNTKLGSNILTYILLYKNLTTHRRIIKADETGELLSNYENPYQGMKALLQSYPELMDRVAVVQDRTITYKELWTEIEAFANYLHAHVDYQKGEIFSVCAASSIEGIISFFALNRLGIISGRVFNGSQADKMKYNINNFSSTVVLIDNDNLEVLLRIVKNTKVKTVILMSEREEISKHKMEREYPEVQFITYREIVEKGKEYNDSFEEEVFVKDPASILYTSGSSGESKPIVIPNRTYMNMMEVVCNTTNVAICDGERVIGVVSQEYPYD